jgi:hypothetical protein
VALHQGIKLRGKEVPICADPRGRANPGGAARLVENLRLLHGMLGCHWVQNSEQRSGG